MVAIAFMATVAILATIFAIWEEYSSKKRFSK